MRGNRSWRTDWRSASVRSQGGRSDGDRQLFEYAFHAGAPLALLTNGVNWRFYSTFSAGTYAERLVRNLDIETEPPDEVAAALDRYLSYANTESGRAADYARVDLDKRVDRRKAREAIPRAWTQLVENEADGRLTALLIDATSALVESAPAKPISRCSRRWLNEIGSS